MEELKKLKIKKGKIGTIKILGTEIDIVVTDEIIEDKISWIWGGK